MWIKVSDNLPPVKEDNTSSKLLWSKKDEYIIGIYNSIKKGVICDLDRFHPIEDFNYWSNVKIIK